MAGTPGISQAITETSTVRMHALGERLREDGKEYIYLTGVASTVAGDFVSFDEAYDTTRLTADAVGAVGVAMSANVASQYGWYQIYGVSTTAKTDTIATNKALYIDGTAGRVDDAVVTGDKVNGAVSLTSDTSNVATVFLSYPYVDDATT